MVNSLFHWLMIGFTAVIHPLYVSVIEVDHNPKDKAVEISVRIFTDDLEVTLKKYTTGKVDLTRPVNKAAMDKLVNNYISSRLQLKIDNKNTALHYIGYELQKESTWVYFEIMNVPSVKKIGLTCSLLYDYQEKQMNIFHVKANGTEKSYKLDNPESVVNFEW
jgi:hypothetical protein